MTSMTASLPDELQHVFDRFVTTEYVTIDRRGSRSRGRSRRTTGRARLHRRDDRARLSQEGATTPQANPRVALLFSDPTGSGLDDPPMVLVQGTAAVDDRDLDANRGALRRASRMAKLPGAKALTPPEFLERLHQLVLRRACTSTSARSGSSSGPRATSRREPELLRLAPGGGAIGAQRGAREPRRRTPKAAARPGTSASTSWRSLSDRPCSPSSAPDGFPFAARLPVRSTAPARRSASTRPGGRAAARGSPA